MVCWLERLGRDVASRGETWRLKPVSLVARSRGLVVMTPSIVVISADYSLYATASLAELQQCKTASVQDYFCPALLFVFLPVTGGICKVVLTQVGARKALELCPYTTLLTKPLFHKTFLHHHYFFFTKPIYISIICPNGTSYREVSGHLAIHLVCHVQSSDLTTFPSHLHKGFIGNFSSRIYPLSSLDSIRIM